MGSLHVQGQSAAESREEASGFPVWLWVFSLGCWGGGGVFVALQTLGLTSSSEVS